MCYRGNLIILIFFTDCYTNRRATYFLYKERAPIPTELFILIIYKILKLIWVEHVVEGQNETKYIYFLNFLAYFIITLKA